MRILDRNGFLFFQHLTVYTCIAPQFQGNNPFNSKGPKNCQMLEKKESIPIQNTHDLLVGTLSIGIPSIYFEMPNCVVDGRIFEDLI